ncbi:MAG: hypothetical protein ACYC7F_07370 [Gemmatimonadaceae bacterium]
MTTLDLAQVLRTDAADAGDGCSTEAQRPAAPPGALAQRNQQRRLGLGDTDRHSTPSRAPGKRLVSEILRTFLTGVTFPKGSDISGVARIARASRRLDVDRRVVLAAPNEVSGRAPRKMSTFSQREWPETSGVPTASSPTRHAPSRITLRSLDLARVISGDS